MLKRTKGRILLTMLVVTGLAGTVNNSTLSNKERKFVIIQLKDTKTEASELKAQDQELIEREKSTEAFRSWVEDFKKSARIETNTALIQQQKE